MPIENLRAVALDDAHDRWLKSQQEPMIENTKHTKNPLDDEESEALLSRLLEWYDTEMLRQGPNRYQMALDQDFYDGLQWSEDDAAELLARGQVPTVYNDIKPVIDWVIGAEKRMRVDGKVLPRTEDDVEMADIKTKVMKYFSDVNQAPFTRSEAFSETVKCGLSWLEDRVQNVPGEEIIYKGWESWRNTLYDSNSKKRNYSDARYVFRWRHIDEDVAMAMFPDRKGIVKQSAIDSTTMGGVDSDDEIWYLGQQLTSDELTAMGAMGRRTYINSSGWIGSRRSTVKVIECWYKVPQKCTMCYGDIFDGEEYDPKNPLMVKAMQQGAIDLEVRTQFVVYCALFTRKGLLQKMRSPYKHNRFPLTPIWCYRRGRDNAPYGMIRNIRDPQESKNKRQSKAQFVISTNQIIGDDGAVEDWNEVREEANRPDGVIIKKKGYDLELRRDYGEVEMLMKYASNDADQIQKGSGVTDDNLGRQTNAKSGIAIERRQDQGSLTTAEPFDGYRLALQISGENELALTEQYVSEPKVVRITGWKKKAVEWVKINQPETMANGETHYLNDITASQADYIVDSQDFSATMRQSLHDEMMAHLSKYPPELAIQLLDMVVDIADFPGKEEFVARIRQMNGMSDPDDEETPEQVEAKRIADEAAAAMAEEEMKAVRLENEEKEAKVEKLRAEAAKIANELGAPEVGGPEAGGGEVDAQQQLAQINERIANELDDIRESYAQAERRLREELDAKMKKDLDKIEVANIDAKSREAVARTQADAQIEIAREKREAQQAIENAVQPMQDEIERLNEMIRSLKTKSSGAPGKETAASKDETKDDAAEEKEEAYAAAMASNIEKLLAIAQGEREIKVTKNENGEASGVVKIKGTGVTREFSLTKGKDGTVTGSMKPGNQPQG